MKKFLSIILILSFLTFCLCGCGDESDNTEKVDNEKKTEEVSYDTALKLAYSKSDSLNPLECKTEINTQLSTLVFEGLFTLSDSLEPEGTIAESGVSSGNVVNVTIGNHRFSDGSLVTTEDIINSFFDAKESPVYSERLSNFINAVSSSENMVMFSLENPDPYALSCLDFPIVKKTVDRNVTLFNETSSDDFPIGSGRYFYIKNGDDVYLTVNTNKASFNPEFKTIKLVSVHDSDSIESSIVIGDTCFYYNNLSSGDYSRLNAHTVDVGLNSLVYLGFNLDYGMLSDASYRNVISRCIDRSEIVKSAFRSHARSTYTPFNPDWFALGTQSFAFDSSAASVKSYISENEIDVTNGQITFLYCTDNPFKAETGALIVDYLKKAGFSVLEKAYSKEAFDYDFEMGLYDMYLGEIKLTNNMDLSVLLGDDITESSIAYNNFLNGKCQLIDFINTFNEDVPFVPVCYRNALASYTNALEAEYETNDNNIFENIDTWSIK